MSRPSDIRTGKVRLIFVLHAPAIAELEYDPFWSLAGGGTCSATGNSDFTYSTFDLTGDGVLDLVVGAPMDGDGAGSVTLYEGPGLDPVTVWQGDDAGANLGTSVAAARGVVVAGAPGAPGTPGSVKIFSVD